MSERISDANKDPHKKNSLKIGLVSVTAVLGGGAAALGLEEVREREESVEPAISSVPSVPLASGNPQNMRVEIDGIEVARLEVPNENGKSGIDNE